MAETLEKVYASALFELCDDENSLKNVYEEFVQVVEIFDANEEYVKLLSSPLVDNCDKDNILIKTFGGKISDLFLDFLCLLSDKGRAGHYERIFNEFKNMYNDKMNILEVKVITTEQISEKIRQRLIDKLEKVTGKNVILKEEIDPSLLGGIIVKYDNTEIDSSVKSKLDKLKRQIDSTIA